MKWGEPYKCPKAASEPFSGRRAGPGRDPHSSSSSESLGQGDRDSNSVAGIWGDNTSKDRTTERGRGKGREHEIGSGDLQGDPLNVGRVKSTGLGKNHWEW